VISLSDRISSFSGACNETSFEFAFANISALINAFHVAKSGNPEHPLQPHPDFKPSLSFKPSLI